MKSDNQKEKTKTLTFRDLSGNPIAALLEANLIRINATLEEWEQKNQSDLIRDAIMEKYEE